MTKLNDTVNCDDKQKTEKNELVAKKKEVKVPLNYYAYTAILCVIHMIFVSICHVESMNNIKFNYQCYVCYFSFIIFRLNY